MYKIALVGATGMVGRKMLEVLAERAFPISELIPVASERSVGKSISFNGKDVAVVDMKTAIEKAPHIAIFSAGGETALQYAPLFANKGTYVIDNSSAFRMDADKALVVPEINGNEIPKEQYIIPNPNCSTIQLVMVLYPLYKAVGIRRVIISTYQSITGTGQKAVHQLENEMAGVSGDMAYLHPIHQNCIPHCDVFQDNGYTKEELKLMNEPMKIMQAPEIRITATAVRVPVMGGHSESVNVTFEKSIDLETIRNILENTSGVVVQDHPKQGVYPMPLKAGNKDAVFVGRIRKDDSFENTFNFWIVADNLRKGAATNAIQIAEKLLTLGYITP